MFFCRGDDEETLHKGGIAEVKANPELVELLRKLKPGDVIRVVPNDEDQKLSCNWGS